MARKRNLKFIRPARREGSSRYVRKQLRKMSSDEIREYFDAVEPIEDNEVDEIIDRIYPRLINEIESAEETKEVHRCTCARRKIIAATVCLTLMLPVVAQALGVPIWETFVAWTREHLIISVSHEGAVEEQVSREGFSEEERQTWGDDVCKAFEDIEYYPALPTWKPEGYDLYSILYMNDESGYAYVDALYHDKEGKTLTLLLEILESDPYEYGISIERDDKQSKEFTIDGTQYFLVSNLDTNTAVWLRGNVSYSLSGHLSFDTLEKMIRSIQYYDRESSENEK